MNKLEKKIKFIKENIFEDWGIVMEIKQGKFPIPDNIKNAKIGDIFIIAKYPKTRVYSEDQKRIKGFRLVINNKFLKNIEDFGDVDAVFDDKMPNDYKRLFRMRGGTVEVEQTDFWGGPIECIKSVTVYPDMVVPYSLRYKIKYEPFRFFSKLYDRIFKKHTA